MKNININRIIKDGRFLLVLIFIIFVVLRFFVHFQYNTIGYDITRYLALAKNFPHHSLYNNLFYTGHPPLYPYLIYFLSFVYKDYLASTLLSFFFSCIFFITITKLFFLLKKNIYWISIAMLFITFNFYHTFLSNLSMKESMIITLFFLTIYYYIKCIKTSKKYFIHASIFSIFLIFTTDLAISLFPIIILSIFFYKKKKIKLVYILIPIIIFLIAFFFWFFLKLYIYKTNLYYPDTLGIINPTGNLNFMNINNPSYFTATKELGDFKTITEINILVRHAFYIFRTLINLAYPFNLIGMNNDVLFSKIYLLFLIYIPLTIFMLITVIYTIYNLTKKFRIKNNTNFFFILITLILFVPVIQAGTTPRYMLQLITPFAYLITEGIFIFIKKINILNLIKKFIPFIIILLFILIIPLWITENPYNILNLTPVIIGEEASKFVNTLPKDGIMVWGYGDEISYLTNKKVISIPPKIKDLDFQIKYFNISYILFLEKNYYNIDTLNYIKLNPAKYKLIKTIDIDYPKEAVTIGAYKNRYFIYKVIK